MAAPCVRAHVRVSGFAKEVTVLASLMKPKLLTLQGDDGAEYRFVAKGGEDLRKVRFTTHAFIRSPHRTRRR